MLFDALLRGSRLVVPAPASALLLTAACAPAGDARAAVGFVVLAVILGLLVLGIARPDRLLGARRVFAAAAGIGMIAHVGTVLSGPFGPEDAWGLVGPLLIAVAALRYAAGGRRTAAQPASPSTAVASVPAEPHGGTGATFARKLEWLLATNPALTFEGRIEPEGHGEIVFPKADDDGFVVAVQVAPREVVVHAELAHVHFDRDEDPEANAAGALACVTDLLGPDVRLRERLAGGHPYLARIEMRTPEGWRLVTATWLLVWNYFGARRERTRQNHALSGRTRGA